MKLESWDPEYHRLNGPLPPVHAEVKFGESKPKPIGATFSSFWADWALDPGSNGLNQNFPS